MNKYFSVKDMTLLNIGIIILCFSIVTLNLPNC